MSILYEVGSEDRAKLHPRRHAVSDFLFHFNGLHSDPAMSIAGFAVHLRAEKPPQTPLMKAWKFLAGERDAKRVPGIRDGQRESVFTEAP